MNFRGLFAKWNLTNIKLNLKFAEVEFQPNENDQQAAWELYVELITRITTQELADCDGDEKTALTSVYSLFATTRSILKEKGRSASSFTKVAIPVLNQIVRPFTAKWHKLSLEGAFQDKEKCQQFRGELKIIQTYLRHYSHLLADIAEVEDITDLEFDCDE